eukprot:TRINITY_DN2192_c0_g2_i1.p1 TRINITY_DN2192_c0_g2~~TRINITY_DN2192_c0_g2_i1.p1  ORF type:complete len:231 (+),score=38.96 TRINITY_DN2192_c0_g2_i1:34-726(+)
MLLNRYSLVFIIYLISLIQIQAQINKVAEYVTWTNSTLGTKWLKSLHNVQLQKIQQYYVPQEKNHCGIATSVILQNIMHGDETKYNQENIFEDINDIVTKEEVSKQGITLRKFSQINYRLLARKYVLLWDRAEPDVNFLFEDFKRNLLSMMKDPTIYIGINFGRQELFGVNVGHFSPIAGYIPYLDQVLVYDVNVNYSPYFIPIDKLYNAMGLVDSSTKKSRGYVVFQTI